MIGTTKKFIGFASLLAALVIVDCWIIRKSCVQEADFSVIKVGHALGNHVVATLNSLSLAQCKENCVDDFRCRSVNHADDDSVCELNDQINELATRGALESKSGWTYHSTNHSVRNIGPICRRQNPCQLTEYCMDSCYCPGYQCVAMPNLALRRPAEQSGIHHHYRYLVPSFANDGDRDTTWRKCAITKNEIKSYWLVDLRAPYLVHSVAVVSSRDWGETNINPYDIRVGNNKAEGGIHNPLCAGNINMVPNKMKTIACDGNKFGRYVSVNKGNKYRTVFCEVEVYGMVV
eukprot:Seg1304.4 transcript_id=Seg1304.4/GoldUCD/mRNA.D3Y31 product=Fucolectin-1 protein_id=Seg1304.4/GoldUCD/D3Y31